MSKRFSMSHVTSCLGALTPETPCPSVLGNKVLLVPYKNASEVKGSLGAQFHPHLEDTETLWVWADPILRALPLRKIGEVTSQGINLWRFSVADHALKNTSEEPANADYYQYLANGFMNITAIQHGVPVFLSQNRFYGCDNSYWNSVSGMKKNDFEADGFYLDIEPNTGMTMGGAAKLQVNVPLGPITYSFNKNTHFKNVKPTLMPISAISVGGKLPQSLAKEFQDQVGWALGPVKWLPWVTGIVGVLLIGTGVWGTVHVCQKKVLTDDAFLTADYQARYDTPQSREADDPEIGHEAGDHSSINCLTKH